MSKAWPWRVSRDKDVVRHPLVTRIVGAYERNRTRMIEIVFEEPRWRKIPGVPVKIKRAMALALARGSRKKKRPPLTLLLATDSRLRELNSLFRGKDKPTNVLSFPAAETGYLGDIAIAYGVMADGSPREGQETGRSRRPPRRAWHVASSGL